MVTPVCPDCGVPTPRGGRCGKCRKAAMKAYKSEQAAKVSADPAVIAQRKAELEHNKERLDAERKPKICPCGAEYQSVKAVLCPACRKERKREWVKENCKVRRAKFKAMGLNSDGKPPKPPRQKAARALPLPREARDHEAIVEAERIAHALRMRQSLAAVRILKRIRMTADEVRETAERLGA